MQVYVSMGASRFIVSVLVGSGANWFFLSALVLCAYIARACSSALFLSFHQST